MWYIIIIAVVCIVQGVLGADRSIPHVVSKNMPPVDSAAPDINHHIRCGIMTSCPRQCEASVLLPQVQQEIQKKEQKAMQPKKTVLSVSEQYVTLSAFLLLMTFFVLHIKRHRRPRIV